MNKYEADSSLSPLELDNKYSLEGDGEHPGYPRSRWREVVAHECTILGYWEWVHHQLTH